MTKDQTSVILNKLRPAKIILPVLIGLAIVVWLFTREISLKSLKEIVFTWQSAFWLSAAFSLVVLRTYGYMARLRVLTDKHLSWMQTFRVIMLWEFTSAITPSTIGGTALAVIFLNKEGLSIGRSTAVVLATSFLDELYFVIALPVLLLFASGQSIFITSVHGSGGSIVNNLVWVTIAGYTIITAWVILSGYGLFFNPAVIQKIISAIFRLPFLKRWKGAADKAGDDIILSSAELKTKPDSFWYKATFLTFLTWTSRYLIVNAILVAFFEVKDHIVIFARQLVLWIMMIISPTPGGSGIAEVILGRYISDFIPVDPAHIFGVALAVAMIWRIITYYPFLLIGVLIIPGWIRRNFVKPFIKK
jgi:glycosyltransferase 2 family protein